MNRHVGWEDKELLGMDQYEMVRTAHGVYKKSIRRISRETGHTRRTGCRSGTDAGLHAKWSR